MNFAPCRLDWCACSSVHSWRQLLYPLRNVQYSDLDHNWIICWFSSVLPDQRVDCSLRHVTSNVCYSLVSLSFDAVYVVAFSWWSGSTSYRMVHTLLWLVCPAISVIWTECLLWRSVSLCSWLRFFFFFHFSSAVQQAYCHAVLNCLDHPSWTRKEYT